MLPAPPRLSMAICWPRFLLMSGDTMRAMMSVLPLAANGTIMRIGFAGYVCEDAVGDINTSVLVNVQLSAQDMFFICILLIVVCGCAQLKAHRRRSYTGCRGFRRGGYFARPSSVNMVLNSAYCASKYFSSSRLFM